MNKRFLLLSLSLLTYTTQAQTISSVSPDIIKRYTATKKQSLALKTILHKQTAQLKTTAAHKRLVGDAFVINLGTPMVIDSNQYFYSNARGSQFDFNDMFYSIDASTGGMLYDSAASYSDNGSGSVDINRATTVQYNSANKRTTRTYLTASAPGAPLVNDSRDAFEYDGSGNITAIYNLQWNSVAKRWDSSSRTINTYNSSNKVTLSEEAYKMGSVWTPTSKRTMTYDGSGNLTQVVYATWDMGSWQDEGRETFTYYPNNKVKTTLSEDFNGSGWDASSLDTFGYNNTDFYTYYETRDWNADSNRWDNSNMEIRHLNSVNIPDTITMYSPDSATGVYQLSFTTVWTYDAENNPIQTEGFADFMGTPISITMTNYYYEYYWDLAVKDMDNRNGFAVYPNPAANVLHVSMQKPLDKKTTAMMYNMSGQLISRIAYGAGISSMSIPLDAMQPGTYTLVLADDTGNKIYKQQVVKQ